MSLPTSACAGLCCFQRLEVRHQPYDLREQHDRMKAKGDTTSGVPGSEIVKQEALMNLQHTNDMEWVVSPFGVGMRNM